MTLVEVAGQGAQRPVERRTHRAPSRRRVARAVPATRALERSLVWALVVAAAGVTVTVIVREPAVAVAALVIAAAALGLALSTARALVELSPGVLKPVRGRAWQPLRVAVIGSVGDAQDLMAELRLHAVARVTVTGAITPESHLTNGPQPLRLGTLVDVRRIVEREAVDVLLVGGPAGRGQVVETVLRCCEGDPVRLCDLCSFYEAVFGRLPLSHVDPLWLQCVLHPRYRERRAQRALDILVSGLLLAVFLPLLGPLAVLIRRDGGPAFFRQERVGRDGRPFVLCKLRSMRWDGGDAPQRWSSAGDTRVTRIGHVLRRSHVDELPQLLSVLRGDMTLVGPRPEQPRIAAELERALPLWRGRYRYKPGLTGWAQIHCGYAGSRDGSAWKLAHDLYYLRHQSLALDVAILVQTARTVLSTPQYMVQVASPFVVRSTDDAGPTTVV